MQRGVTEFLLLTRLHGEVEDILWPAQRDKAVYLVGDSPAVLISKVLPKEVGEHGPAEQVDVALLCCGIAVSSGKP